MPKLRFNKKIYKKKAVQQAVSAYGHLGCFDIKDSGLYVEVSISRPNHDIKDILADEFKNYVLGATKQCL